MVVPPVVVLAVINGRLWYGMVYVLIYLLLMIIPLMIMLILLIIKLLLVKLTMLVGTWCHTEVAQVVHTRVSSISCPYMKLSCKNISDSIYIYVYIYIYIV